MGLPIMEWKEERRRSSSQQGSRKDVLQGLPAKGTRSLHLPPITFLKVDNVADVEFLREASVSCMPIHFFLSLTVSSFPSVLPKSKALQLLLSNTLQHPQIKVVEPEDGLAEDGDELA